MLKSVKNEQINYLVMCIFLLGRAQCGEIFDKSGEGQQRYKVAIWIVSFEDFEPIRGSKESTKYWVGT